MAQRDGLRPQIDFPQLIADVIRDLNVRGPLGVLNLSDEVRPVFIIGARGLTVTANLVDFDSSQVFSGDASLPVASTVVADTGQLVAGTYDLLLQLSSDIQVGSNDPIRVQHRNSGNTATLATLLSLYCRGGAVSDGQSFVPLIGYRIALNERIRILSPSTNATSGGCSGQIWAARRLVP